MDKGPPNSVYQLSKTITKERNISLNMIKFPLYQLSNQGLFELQLTKQVVSLFYSLFI